MLLIKHSVSAVKRLRVINGDNGSVWGFCLQSTPLDVFAIIITAVSASQRGLLFAQLKMLLYCKCRILKTSGSFWPFQGAVHAIALTSASTVLVMLAHHGTITMRITLLWFPHEADITVTTAERSLWLIDSFCSHVLGLIGRKQIHFISSEVPPFHHADIHCAHTCVKLKLSWPYIWLRMLFLLLKGFICRNISGDMFSRFGGRRVAGVIATRCWYIYHRRCQQTEMAAEPMRTGVWVGASTQTCVWLSIFIRCVERNPIMILSVGINESDLYRLLPERPQNRENSVEKRVYSKVPKIGNLPFSTVLHLLRLHSLLHPDWLLSCSS